jgi:serine/threonine-protein kinase
MPGEVLPSTLGRYEIRSVIGRGMMGVVYEAVDPALGRIVALKTIQLGFGISDHERRVFEERFLTEARLAAGLNHPAIVVVHDVGWDDQSGTPFMALEYLKGVTLADRLEDGRPLDWRESLRIIAKIADALHVAHQDGVVHRDVKPANIMLLPSGEPKIMDFGIAKAPTSQLTAAGDVFGTPSYMSPEQATGVAVDGRSDIFSLGTILYQMLTGQRAFDAPNVPAILSRVTHDAPLAPLQLMPTLPPAVEEVLARAMAKEPAQRYADGRELAEDIEDVLAGRPLRERPGLASTLTGQPSLPPPPRGAGEVSPQTLASTATASLIDRTARVDTLGASGPDWAGGTPASPGPVTAGAPPKPRSALAPGLALAGMLVVAAVSGAVAVSLTSDREASAALPPATAPGEQLTAPDSEAPDGSGEAGSTPSETADETGLTGVSESPSTVSGPTPARDPSATARSGSASRPGDAGWVSHTPATSSGGDGTGSGGAAAPAAPTPGRGPAPAMLLLRVQHSLKRGELRVSAPDGSLVFRHRLRGEEGKTLGVFTTHKGGLEQTIEVPPGTYFVRVEAIEDEDKKKAGLLRGTFRSGQTRVLEVKVAGHMELRWR